jgi:non-ribosomal peptide synthetase component F
MVLLAGLAALFHHATGRRDLLMGAYTSLRTWPQLESLIGLFVNLVVLRIEVDPARTFRALLAGTRATALEAFENGDVAFEAVTDALRGAGRAAPDLQVIAVHAGERGETSLSLPGLEAAPVILPGLKVARLPRGRFPWGLTVEAADEGVFRAAFDPRRYEPAGVRWLLTELAALLERAAADPALRIADLAPRTPPPGAGPWWLPRALRGWRGA